MSRGTPAFVRVRRGPYRIPIEDRLWDKVDLSAGPDGCWMWLASVGGGGYGRISLGGADGGWAVAHRVVYELLVGPIPDGLVIDQLCRVRACVNPRHLEPVTHAENIRRGLRGRMVTHCPRGHEYDVANTRYWRGRRDCRTCDRDLKRTQRAARRAA